jgi:hypothetical protein
MAEPSCETVFGNHLLKILEKWAYVWTPPMRDVIWVFPRSRYVQFRAYIRALGGSSCLPSGRRMFHAVASERLAGIVAWSQELLPPAYEGDLFLLCVV